MSLFDNYKYPEYFSDKKNKSKHDGNFLNNAIYSMSSVPGRELNIPIIANQQSQIKHKLYIPNKYKRFNDNYNKKISSHSNVSISDWTENDPGPVLKLLGPLSDNSLDDKTIIIVGDDDVMHDISDISKLYNHVKKYPKVIAQADPYSNDSRKNLGIHGSNGFALRKDICSAGKLRSFLLDHCIKVDDALLTAFFQYLNIPIVGVPVSRKLRNGLTDVNRLVSTKRKNEHDACVLAIKKNYNFHIDCTNCIL